MDGFSQVTQRRRGAAGRRRARLPDAAFAIGVGVLTNALIELALVLAIAVTNGARRQRAG